MIPVVCHRSLHRKQRFAWRQTGSRLISLRHLRPTPELSFAVRKLGCIAGINITASHNPPEYNGYKVYWEDGAQITPPHDTGIMSEVKAITDWNTRKDHGQGRRSKGRTLSK